MPKALPAGWASHLKMPRRVINEMRIDDTIDWASISMRGLLRGNSRLTADAAADTPAALRPSSAEARRGYESDTRGAEIQYLNVADMLTLIDIIIHNCIGLYISAPLPTRRDARPSAPLRYDART